MKKLLSICLILCIMLCFAACGSEKKAPEEIPETTAVVEEIADTSFVTGTYVGNQGSAISVYEDGEAVYYWNGWEEIKSGNKWHYDDGVLTITVDALECDITAEIDEQIAEGDEIIFKSDSINWDNETFIKAYSDRKKLTANEYRKVIEAIWPTMENKRITSDYQEDNCEKIYIGGYRFLVSDGLEIKKEDNKINVTKSDILMNFVSYKDDNLALVYALYQDQIPDELVKNAFSNFMVEKKDPHAVEFGEASGDCYDYVATMGNYHIYAHVILSFTDETNELLVIGLFYQPKDEEKVMKMYENVIGSAKKEAEPITEEVTEPAAKESQNDGVDPELKAFLDSYEEFIDRYVEFMKDYMKGTNMAGMLADYAKIMSEYAEFTSKLEKIDEKSLSAADYAYYLEVTSRTLKKMSEIL